MKIIDINGLPRDCTAVDSDSQYPGFVKVTYPSPRHPDQPRVEWYPTADFLAANPDFKTQLAAPPPQDAIGIVTKAGKNNLTDNTQSWTPNIYTGFTLWISRGLGEGQTRMVTKNSHNVVYVDQPWQTKPDKTSQYVISYNIHDPSPQGNIIPGQEML